MKVNIFSGPDPEIIEECINEWLAENPNIYLWKVTQSESGTPDEWSLTFAVWYNEPAPLEG